MESCVNAALAVSGNEVAVQYMIGKGSQARPVMHNGSDAFVWYTIALSTAIIIVPGFMVMMVMVAGTRVAEPVWTACNSSDSASHDKEATPCPINHIPITCPNGHHRDGPERLGEPLAPTPVPLPPPVPQATTTSSDINKAEPPTTPTPLNHDGSGASTSTSYSEHIDSGALPPTEPPKPRGNSVTLPKDFLRVPAKCYQATMSIQTSPESFTVELYKSKG